MGIGDCAYIDEVVAMGFSDGAVTAVGLGIDPHYM